VEEELETGTGRAEEEDLDLRAEEDLASLTEERRRDVEAFSDVVREGAGGGGIEEAEFARAVVEGAVRVRVGD
jgi:hypothetical protein